VSLFYISCKEKTFLYYHCIGLSFAQNWNISQWCFILKQLHFHSSSRIWFKKIPTAAYLNFWIFRAIKASRHWGLKPTIFGNFFTPWNLSHVPVVFFMCILILWFYRYKHILVWFDGHLSSTTLFARNTNILSLLVKIDRQHISSMEESLFFKRFFFLFLVICPMVIWLIQKEHLWGGWEMSIKPY
jgi:hypothetical protein